VREEEENDRAYRNNADAGSGGEAQGREEFRGIEAKVGGYQPQGMFARLIYLLCNDG
jgi:hypothetical protein